MERALENFHRLLASDHSNRALAFELLKGQSKTFKAAVLAYYQPLLQLFGRQSIQSMPRIVQQLDNRAIVQSILDEYPTFEQKMQLWNIPLVNKKIEEVKASKKKWYEVPKEIWQLHGLHYLDLSHNNLHYLAADIGHLGHLQQLYLNDNQLEVLPTSIVNLKNLLQLHIDNNQLLDLPEDIQLLEKLEVLRGHQNQLSYLPESIGHLTNLRILYLSNNNIQELPSSIEYLTNLHTLSITNNQLQTFPASIATLQDSLKVIYVKYNRLTAAEEERLQTLLPKTRIVC